MDFTMQLERGCNHLRQSDSVLATLIDMHGLPDIVPHANYYQTLAKSIISQQLSVKAAATITTRFIDLFDHFPTPSDILATDFDTLRAVGLSGQKTNYIRDLATKVADGTIHFEHLDSLDNQQIIAELTTVKGVGEWTVHMLLMFCMGRLNVLAAGDLGVRNAVTRLYGFDVLASPADITAIATLHDWAPYQTVACWYLWRSLDSKPAIG